MEYIQSNDETLNKTKFRTESKFIATRMNKMLYCIAFDAMNIMQQSDLSCLL